MNATVRSHITRLLIIVITTISLLSGCSPSTVSSGVEPGEPSTVEAQPTPVPVGALAQPGDYGFTVPNPEPALPAKVDAFNPPLLNLTRSGPLFSESIRTAAPNEIVSATGVDFISTTKFEVFAQTNAHDGALANVSPLKIDSSAATILMPAALPNSMYLIFPNSGSTRTKPLAINRTEAWWVGPKNDALVGQTISLFGRNLSYHNGTTSALIYIKPANASGQYVTPTAVNPFKVDFVVPNLTPGQYEIWAHNGQGGRFGWSGPVALKVLAKSPWSEQDQKILNVKNYGARGDGASDDTSAIQSALSAARNSAPATVYFPAGTYLTSRCLTAPDNVRWLGDGPNSSEIKLSTRLSASNCNAMINGDPSQAQFEALTLNGNGLLDVGPWVLIYFTGGENIRLRNVRIDAYGFAPFEITSTGLTIENSEIIGTASFGSSSHQVFLINNVFRATNDGEASYTSWGGVEVAMIGNMHRNADESRSDGHGIGRMFVAQGHFGSLRNLYFGDNVSENFAPRDCRYVDCNKGEQIVFEMMSTSRPSGFSKATATTVSFSSVDFTNQGGGTELVIIGGRGAGQHRRIVSVNNGNGTATLDKPWAVIPDSSSKFVATSAALQTAIYNNRFDGRSTYHDHDSDSTAVLLCGNAYDVVVDHNQISRMRHAMMAYASTPADGFAPYFNLFSNNIVRDSNSGIYVGTTFASKSEAGVFGGLGTVFRNNTFTNLAHIGVEFESWDYLGGDFDGTVIEHNLFTNLPFGFINGYHLMWTYDRNFSSGPASSRSKMINTILYDNAFDRGTAPLTGSIGFRANSDGTYLNLGNRWTGFATANGP